MNGSYSSPPCYASEVAPDYFGAVPAMTCSELLALLRQLLADEQAAASASAVFLRGYEADSTIWKQFAALQRCGSKNCATLIDLIGRLGDNDHQPSEHVAANLPASRGARAQTEWLAHSQRRLARSIHDALPAIEQDFVRHALTGIEDSHLFSIETCEALVEIL